MGLVYADIELVNFKDELLAEEGYKLPSEIRRTKTSILANSGAIRLTINEDLKNKLGLKQGIPLVVTLADGTNRTVESVSGIRVIYKERSCEVDAFVMPGNSEPLLGAVPMELMDLAILPYEGKLDYNPAHPNGPIFHLK